MLIEDVPPRNPRHSSTDLQLAVLRHLPTPILVLSPKRTAVFANRAADRLLGLPDPIQSHNGKTLDRSPAELGIKLLYNRTWDVVLDKLASAHKLANAEGESVSATLGTEGLVHEADAVVSNTSLTYAERHFRVLISTLTADDGTHYVLSFERSAHIEKKLIPKEDHISSPDGCHFVMPSGVSVRHDPSVDGLRDIFRIKKSVFDSSNVAGFILSLDEKFYLTNKKTREILGDVMGGADGCDDGLNLSSRLEIWDEHFTRRLAPREFPGMRLVRARTPFTDYRCGFIHAVTGDKVVMNVSGECLYDDDTDEFMGGICWCRDLQEYSDFLSEQQQRRLESHETICNLMPHMVWTTTPDGMCDWYSERWYEFTGMSKEESIGRGFQKVIHPEDLPVLLSKWEKSTRDMTECEVEIRYRRKDGIFRWMLSRACPLRDDSGKLLKWYGTNTDIHDLVMARIEARRNKLQMLTVLAHAEVNLFSINKDRKITMAEGGMLSQGEDIHNKLLLIGKDCIENSQSTQPGGVPGYEKNILDILAGKVGMAMSEDLIGERVYRTRVVAELEHNNVDGAKKPEVKGVLGLSIDVTHIKARAQLELDNTRLMLEEQAAKDSSRLKSQFLANMSHEMRTPTAGVIGMVELLADDPTLSTEQREYVNSIQFSAKALLTIVNDILDFSKIESGRLDIEELPFNLSSTVGELSKLLSMFANQKGLEFVYENEMDDSLEVLGDPGRIRQVLSNLLTNALKFTKEGRVKTSVTAAKLDPRLVGEETLEVKFVIEDTGIGIEKHVLDKLFRPFSQGDASTARLYGGTGLGLTISKNLATLMHGSITLESVPSVGSKATFIVPLKVSSWCRNPAFSSGSPPNPGFRHYSFSSDSSSWRELLVHRSMSQVLPNQQISNNVTSYSPTPAPFIRKPAIDTTIGLPQLDPQQRSQIHVLVVEDNAINQTIAIKTIQKLGFPVTAVWNGCEALSYLRSPSQSRPRPSIILMDVQMPVMDGYEATRILRTEKEYAEGKKGNMLKDIPVIAMTASAIQGDKEKCHDAGMDDYLTKPVEKVRLEEMLVKWAGKKRF